MGQKRNPAIPEGFDRNEYETPDWLFRALHREFGFEVDLAANRENAKLERFCSPGGYDGLETEWELLMPYQGAWAYINPPYRPLKPWIEAVQRNVFNGSRVVALVPAVTVCTTYFQKVKPQQIRFVVGRIPFCINGVPVNGNRDDSVILVYDGQAIWNREPEVTWVPRAELEKAGEV